MINVQYHSNNRQLFSHSYFYFFVLHHIRESEKKKHVFSAHCRYPNNLQHVKDQIYRCDGDIVIILDDNYYTHYFPMD